MYKGWHPVVQKLIDLMEDEPGCWALYDRLPLKQWVFEEGKVVLMGDSAHVIQSSTYADSRLCYLTTVKEAHNQSKMPIR